MNSWVIAALSCTVGFLSGSGRPSTGTLRSCAAGDAAACARLEAGLAMVFAGGNEADREVGQELASAAVQVIRDRSVAAVERCAADEADACDRIANVLVGLFAGADAQLDASADRLLARAIASRVSSIVAKEARE